MNKRIWFIILAVVSLAASAVMYYLRNDSHLSELGRYFWTPITLGIFAIVMAIQSKNNKQE